MAQLVQPLTRIGNKTAAGRIGQLWIIGEPRTEPRHPFSHPLGKRQCRWRSELLLQKVMKTLLATLQILKTFGGRLSGGPPDRFHCYVRRFQTYVRKFFHNVRFMRKTFLSFMKELDHSFMQELWSCMKYARNIFLIRNILYDEDEEVKVVPGP